jgi:UDP-N-acetylmuramyl tripeptide synthase
MDAARRVLDGAVGSDLNRWLAAQGAMIERLCADSRRCAPGVAFLAYPGESADGRRHIADALQRGSSAVLWEAEGFAWNDAWRVPNIAVRDLKAAAGPLAHEFYGRPSESLWTCGVTGTNGKTSCSQWIAALLGAQGVKTAVIGTLGSGFPGALAAESNTTPDALELHRRLAELLGRGAQGVAMEASSHGLAQGRLNGVAFDCALFTNLSQDHLDYHGTLDAYAEAKSRLFEMPGLEVAVLNLDDVVGVRLLETLPAVPGRMQRLGGDGRPLVFVDYAHTPDALEKVLQALRPVADARGGNLIAVFGAGGDRDPTKRAPMGAAASRHADRLVLTSDNPRSEDPLAIISAVRTGVTAHCIEEPDRGAAIEGALHAARAADVILLAGKGHETVQEIAGRKLPFSDVAVATAALARWTGP